MTVQTEQEKIEHNKITSTSFDVCFLFYFIKMSVFCVYARSFVSSLKTRLLPEYVFISTNYHKSDITKELTTKWIIDIVMNDVNNNYYYSLPLFYLFTFFLL